ncbi:response regulator receiver domain-containing protein [Kribbella amoyensis]|uniref:Response regulator receiver domain-containing protein n=1 Tax=Kribbella amoyensis TaxID=996641 RepID=A0A561C0P6_9ACTN|nr:response regulator transcription factor [Kribbella amoyensis]TWD84736.1 response regulator receiver domain-containing protein [Kribbella amoyensis]
MALRCFIVDDSPRFLSAARSLLERDGFTVVGVASTADEAVRGVDQERPEVVLVDVELGRDSGFDLVRRIARETDLDPGRVILISTYAEDDLRDLVADAPVAAFLSKSRLSGPAIRDILEDGARRP